MAELRAPSAEMNDQELLQSVVQFYRERLQDHAPAQRFLRKRGLADGEMMTHFQLGFADRELGRAIPTNACRTGRQLRERLTRLGIYRSSGHGHFNGCLVVPIFGPTGDVREIYGRKITSKIRTPDLARWLAAAFLCALPCLRRSCVDEGAGLWLI